MKGRGRGGDGLCEQSEHVVTVCGCSDGDGVDESMEGQLSAEANKQDPPESPLVSVWPAEFLAGLWDQRVMCRWSMMELWMRPAVLSPLDGGSL